MVIIGSVTAENIADVEFVWRVVVMVGVGGGGGVKSFSCTTQLRLG